MGQQETPGTGVGGQDRRHETGVEIRKQPGHRDLVGESQRYLLGPHESTIRVRLEQCGATPGSDLADRPAAVQAAIRQPPVDPLDHPVKPTGDIPGLELARRRFERPARDRRDEGRRARDAVREILLRHPLRGA